MSASLESSPRPQVWPLELAAVTSMVLAITIIIMLILIVAALVGGGVIALLASRSAPDGFEDQEGFHVGRTPPTLRSKRRQVAGYSDVH